MLENIIIDKENYQVTSKKPIILSPKFRNLNQDQMIKLDNILIDYLNDQNFYSLRIKNSTIYNITIPENTECFFFLDDEKYKVESGKYQIYIYTLPFVSINFVFEKNKNVEVESFLDFDIENYIPDFGYVLNIFGNFIFCDKGLYQKGPVKKDEYLLKKIECYREMFQTAKYDSSFLTFKIQSHNLTNIMNDVNVRYFLPSDKNNNIVYYTSPPFTYFTCDSQNIETLLEYIDNNYPNTKITEPVYYTEFVDPDDIEQQMRDYNEEYFNKFLENLNYGFENNFLSFLE